MSELMTIVKSLEKRMDSQQQSFAAANNQPSFQQDFIQQGQRGRGRGFKGQWRGNYGRGNVGRGASSGSFQSRKENPQKMTQLSSRSHPRHLVGKRTAQKTPT